MGKRTASSTLSKEGADIDTDYFKMPKDKTIKAKISEEIEYQKLNIAFKDAVLLEIKEDSIVDLAPLFKQYKQHRDGINSSKEQEFSEEDTEILVDTRNIAPFAFKPPSDMGAFTAPIFNVPSLTPMASTTILDAKNMSGNTQTDKPSQENSTGFKFTAPLAQEHQVSMNSKSEAMPFSFNTPAPAKVVDEQPKPFSFNTSINVPIFSSGTPSESTLQASSDAVKPDAPKPLDFTSLSTLSNFSFGTSNQAVQVSESPKPFGFTSANAVSNFSFGSSNQSTVQNRKHDETPKPFSFTSAQSATNEKPFSFGVSSPQVVTEPKVEKPMSFTISQTDSDPKPPQSFSFNFGSSSFKPLEAVPSQGINPTPFAFTFNNPSGGSSLFNTSKPNEESGDDDGEDAPVEPADSTPSLIASNEGEEQEDTVHEDVVRVHMANGTSGFQDFGRGSLKVNRPKETGRKWRIICRAEGTGKMLINSYLSSPPCSVEQRDATNRPRQIHVTLKHAETGLPTLYIIQVKELEKVAPLINSIKEGIAASN